MNVAKQTVALVYQSWLVGAGSYDTGREIAVSKFDQLFVDGSALFNDLLEKGELIESQLQAKLEARKMLKNKISALSALPAISALKEKFGFGNEAREQKLEMLSQRVDSLVEVVAKLAQQKTAENKTTADVSVAQNVPAKKKAVTKEPTKTKVKPVVKAAAKKAPAKPRTRKTAVKLEEDVKINQ